jgi:hypothetical protein
MEVRRRSRRPLPAGPSPPGRLAALACAALALQGAGSGARAGADPAALSQLLLLPGERAAVRYTPGALDRAAHVQARLAVLASDFASWSGRATPLRALVLSPEDWRAAGLRRPYGLAERTPTGELAAPAWGSEETVALWRGLTGAPPPWAGGLPVRGTPEEAGSLALADLVLQVECGRLFVEGGGLGPGELAGGAPDAAGADWVSGLAAHVVALVALVRHEPARLDQVSAFWRLLGAAGTGAAAAGVERASGELPLGSWLAREAALHAGARLIVERDGAKSVKRLQALRRARGGLTAAALLGRYPELGPWLRAAGGA